MDVYILDPDLKPLAVVDGYKSLIWTNRYNEIGACELYVEANAETLGFCRVGNYIIRSDDFSMACRIARIELDTSSENGNYLIVNGEDSKVLLDRRIVWGTATCNGNVETFARSLIERNIINAEQDRRMKKSNGYDLIALDSASGLPAATTESLSYRNIGEKIREYCKAYGYGYRFKFYDLSFDRSLLFGLYQGTDRTDSVIFSDDFENLASSKYIDDETNIGNVALIAGAGQGASRYTSNLGNATGVDRAEVYVDARDLSQEANYEELTELYPGGTINAVATGAYVYHMAALSVLILSDNHKQWLVDNYPTGGVITIDSVEYYRLFNIDIASLSTSSPAADTEVYLYDIVYFSLLQSRGIDKLSEFGVRQEFEGVALPQITFIYNRDYFLGDIVRVENQFGIGTTARIAEVTETFDENGHNVAPKFEYFEGIQNGT